MFTPSSDVLQALERLAEVTGRTLARTVNEQLEPLVDDMHHMAGLLEDMDNRQREALDAVRAAGDDVREAIQPALEEATAALDNLVAVAGRKRPPSSNTGVTTSVYQGKLFAGRRG